MTRYALLLRSVNVGTKNSLPMAELRALLEDCGCREVKTYVQSGNAVFATKLGVPELTRGVERALERRMGRPIAIALRTQAELNAIVAHNPLASVATKPSFSCVTFLSHAPTAAELAPLHAEEWSPEQFRVAGREIYTWHPDGQAKERLSATLGKLALRGTVTTRNWNTVLKLTELLGER